VFQPEMVLIRGGKYVVGWDGDERRIQKAWPTVTVDRYKYDGGRFLEDFPVGDRRFVRPPSNAEIDALATTRTVRIVSFQIAKYELTREEFSHFCKETGREVPWRERAPDNGLPANGLSWDDAVDYCKWLSDKTGRSFRLPTSDEWEVVAQGPERWTFPWGNEFPHDDSEQMVDLFVRRPNAYGVYHMGWFVIEWCQDRWPGEPDAGILRGGFMGQEDWSDIIYFCAMKFKAHPERRGYASGLRLAEDVSTHTTLLDSSSE
jgi:formylglycine-generating enzyme required for sulfatase activity